MTQEEFFNRYSYSVSRDRIGGGSFGTVYKAYDNTLHREVAIKVSEEKTTTDGKKTFSLKDEFEALSHVPKHPNIANYEEFYSFEMPNGIFDYAVMQYYPDGNLSDAIKQGLTDEQKEDIATQLLEGIDFLHKHKVVHRDLKPGNILVVRHGGKVIPLITDFGLSKATSVVDGSVFSNSFGAGTPKYSSPEQLQGKPLRFNTDLWSYGAILYELFTGTQLFSAGSGAANTAQADLEIYNKIVNGDVRGLSKMPEIWRKVAERCLVVDATKRAKDAVELFGLIRGDDDETEITVGPSTGSETEGLGGTIPSSKGGSGSTPPSKGAGGIKEASPKSIDEPKSKKALWVDLSIKIIWIVVGILVALLVLHLWQENESAPTDPDTQAYEDCQTVEDYRAYMSQYGINALHYADALAFVEQHKADSADEAQQIAAQQQAQRQAEAKAQAQKEKKEDDAYMKCTTIAACDSYLKAYPQGRYVQEVRTKKAQLEDQTQQQAEAQAQAEKEKKEDDAYKKCTTVAACDSYLKAYPQGRYVQEVRIKKAQLEAQAQQHTQQQSGNDSSSGHDYVDLGLPSGTLWATCNIGANKPEDYGNYYEWGETSTKNTYYIWKSYKYAKGTSWEYPRLTKYCNKSSYGNNGFTDNLTELQSGDDPATTYWGNEWHTPTKTQWDELLSNTKNEWATRNDVKGRLFTSKKNGKTLFLPAAGNRWDSGLYSAGSYGFYWSRSLSIDNPSSAWGLYFYSGRCGMDGYDRSGGFTVRPVHEK